MSFLTPLFLLGGLAIAGPILFHLIRRNTRERFTFSSLMFLRPEPPRLTRKSRLEDILLLEEDDTPAVFDRNSNAFIKIYFDIPEGREDELARKVLMKHLISGNSYGIQLKEKHCKFHQVELGPWVADSKSVGDNYTPQVLEGWEPPAH